MTHVASSPVVGPLEHEAHGASSEHPGRIDPGALATYRRFVRPTLRRLWPSTFLGVEHLPKDARYLLVANHSGLGVAETLVLVDAWTEHVGDRRLSAMVHSSLMRAPGIGDLLRAAGAVEASREGARWARAAGSAVLVFPGGDHEAMRPIWRARRVDFANRHGWIHLARELDVPIVPLAITGSHVTLPSLGCSRRLATAVGLRHFGMHRVPLPVLSIAAAFASLRLTRGRSAPTRGALAALAYAMGVFVPFVPSHIGFHVLQPVQSNDVGKNDDDAIYARVTGAIAHVLATSKRRPGSGETDCPAM